MGVVYKARDTHLNRFLAIKVIRPGRVAEPGAQARRFVQEAKAARPSTTPTSSRSTKSRAADGVDFIAMEYVPGDL